MENLGKFTDSITGAPYELVMEPSAFKLSKALKGTYEVLGINPDDFNTDNSGADVSENPPSEIYEYQNFFLLERNDGKVILLDGFRRLLWYSAPHAQILVRKYKQADLTDQQILTLMVNLNHFKFFGGSSWQERGFGLLIKAAFDVDITNFREAFEAYLSSNETKNNYWLDKGKGTAKLNEIKKRITNEHFVSDMKFISRLNEEGCMVNHFFGALVFQERLKSKNDFDADKFLELASEDKVLADLMKKFEKAGTNRSAKSQEAVNQIQDIYANYFTIMGGGEVEKSYAEKVQECKDLRTKLNKDKTLSKLTTNSYYDIERYMMEKLKKDKKHEFEFTVVVMPEKEKNMSFSNGSIPLIDYGILPHKIEFLDFWRYNSLTMLEMRFGFNDPETGVNWEFIHNRAGGYSHGYSKKYTKVEAKYDKELFEKYGVRHRDTRDVEVWINIPKSEWKRD